MIENSVKIAFGAYLPRIKRPEFPKKYFKDILDYMGITEERFWEVIDKARSPHLWKKEDGKWRLLHQVE